MQLRFHNLGTYFENATVCSKRTLKTTVATQLNKSKYKNLGRKKHCPYLRIMSSNFYPFKKFHFFFFCEEHVMEEKHLEIGDSKNK